MRTLRAQILALPPQERLDHALFLIEEITGRPEQAHAELRARFGLTAAEAKVFCVLNAAAPRMLTREAIHAAVYGHAGDAQLKTIDVFICKTRAKTGVTILTHWGSGYSIPNPISLCLSDPMPPVVVIARPSVPATRHSRSLRSTIWTPADDAELRRMVGTGSDLAAIAEELERSDRGITDRMTLHGLRFNRRRVGG